MFVPPFHAEVQHQCHYRIAHLAHFAVSAVLIRPSFQNFATSRSCSWSFPPSALYCDSGIASVSSSSFTSSLPSKSRTFTMSQNTSLYASSVFSAMSFSPIHNHYRSCKAIFQEIHVKASHLRFSPYS